uniref:Sperm microtubule inner protein 6 n=1 Tax=Sphenodon punctatus TaxID=8508 RepID=A0A8D0GYM3_SPHPU
METLHHLSLLEVVVNMLNSLSRHQLPSLQHRYVIPGRMPYQGYYSPCTGRHYCLRGMDYYVDGAPCNERHLNQLVEKIVRFGGLHTLPCHCPCATPLFSYLFPTVDVWDTSNFKKSGGPMRDSFVIHPEFISEAFPSPPCW